MKKTFKDLADFIFSKCKYFDTYFDYGILENNSGMIYSECDGGYKPIFPSDQIGSYFLFLINDKIKITKTNKIKANSGGYWVDSIPFSLVAIVNNADEIKLLNNLRNIIEISKFNIELINANIVTENVVVELLSKTNEDIIINALERIKGQTIIKLDAILYVKFFATDCIEDTVCKDC